MKKSRELFKLSGFEEIKVNVFLLLHEHIFYCFASKNDFRLHIPIAYSEI